MTSTRHHRVPTSADTIHDRRAHGLAPCKGQNRMGIWQRPGDFGFIAEHELETIVAAWHGAFPPKNWRFSLGRRRDSHRGDRREFAWARPGCWPLARLRPTIASRSSSVPAYSATRPHWRRCAPRWAGGEIGLLRMLDDVSHESGPYVRFKPFRLPHLVDFRRRENLRDNIPHAAAKGMLHWNAKFLLRQLAGQSGARWASRSIWVWSHSATSRTRVLVDCRDR